METEDDERTQASQMSHRSICTCPVVRHIKPKPHSNRRKCWERKQPGGNSGSWSSFHFVSQHFPPIKIYISHLRWLPSPTPKLPERLRGLTANQLMRKLNRYDATTKSITKPQDDRRAPERPRPTDTTTRALNNLKNETKCTTRELFTAHTHTNQFLPNTQPLP